MPDRPQNPALARVFDKAIRSGHEIRHVDETQVVTFHKPPMGCLGFLFVLTLVIISLGLVLVLGILSLGRNSGVITTYTLKPNGKIKRREKRV